MQYKTQKRFHPHRTIDCVRSFFLPTLIVFFTAGASAQNVPLPFKTADGHNENTKLLEQNSWGRSCVKPVWPKQSLLREEEGSVDVNFVVDVEGNVIETKIRKSSGFPMLDQATRQAIERCRFQPEYADGKPVQTSQTLRYVWSLEDPNPWQYKFPPSSWLNR